MALIAVINCYNGVRTIEDCVSRILPHVDRVVAFDGAYGDFPVENGSRRSTDGTLEILARLGVEVVDASGHQDQVGKRTSMFAVGGPGDWILPLDADHWLSQPERLRALDLDHCDVGWFWTASNLYPDRYRTARLFRWVPGMHYAGRHHWIFDGRGRLITSDQNRGASYRHVDYEVTLQNLRQYHLPDRLAGKRAYNRHREQRTEGKFRSESSVYGPQDMTPHPERAGKTMSGEVHELQEQVGIPPATLIVPFSRPWAWQTWFQVFGSVELPPGTQVLAVVDHDDQRFFAGVVAALRKMAGRLGGIRVRWTRERPPAEQAEVRHRRPRIIGHWRWFQTEALAPIILGAEDDTLPTADAYTRLLDLMRQRGAAFVQGTEIGRWRIPIVPHWQIEVDAAGDPCRVATGTYTGQMVERIHGGGWYCFAVRADLFRAADIYCTSAPPMGPDVCFVWDLCRAGHLCLGDWSVECWHFTESKRLHPAVTSSLQIAVSTRDASGTWRQTREAAEPYRRDFRMKFPGDLSAEPPPAYRRPAPFSGPEPVKRKERNMPTIRIRLLKPCLHARAGAEVCIAPRLARNLIRNGFAVAVSAAAPPEPVLALEPEPVVTSEPESETEPEPVVAPEPEPVNPLACPECGREFAQTRGLKAHMRQKHGKAVA